MLMVVQLLLLLCVGSSVSEDLMTPTVNIIAELGKLKKMEEKIQTLQETLNTVLSENAALKSLVQDSQNKLESFLKENKAQKIAFSAGLLASGEGYTGPFKDDWKTLVYKKVFSNIGDAYDSNTGIFTAPVKGAYYFRFYAHSRSRINLGAGLFKNNVPQCSVFSFQPTRHSNASNGVVLTLEPGDQVHIKVWSNAQVYDDIDSLTSFSGFLIFPL
ncbi:complement C1q-like protein 3 [Paramisgurnus dabryanus]|uniref:complement C1q-like protein 3 n=1 Tax=Paramisgurnus dabryanus TaxID=90735 RepID=UPI0031F38CAE